MITTTNEHAVRLQKRKEIIAMGIVPYAPRYKKLQTIGELIENHTSRDTMWLLRNIDDIIVSPVREISTAGRLILYRSHGKLAFGKLMDETWEIQIMFHTDSCKMLKNRPPQKVNGEYQSLDSSNKAAWRHIVKMVIVDDDGLIACSYAGTFNNYSLPGGGVDEGDNFYDAVHREAKEETGTPVQVLYELPKIHEYLKKRNRHQLVYGFLCKQNGPKGETEFIESEILDGFAIQRLPLDDFITKVQHQITNPDHNPDREQLDGIFKRDLILLEAAKELLNQTKLRDNHEEYQTITEIRDEILWPDQSVITPYQFIEKYIDVGDFIGIKWELFTTHKWEATIFVSEYQLLSKAVLPLGDKFHGLGENDETPYRQRYLDMIFNRDTLERMKLRSKFLRTLRNFYDEQWFIELETPILGNFASGAAAAPFVTHHHDFDQDMYLRISPETNLKKATVGMLEKVFEVAKDFRNEGSDPSHIQEFTMIEHYAAYRNYEDNMRFTEEMFTYIFAHLPELSPLVSVTNKEWTTHTINFQPPRNRIDYIAQIQIDSGIDVSLYGTKDAESLRSQIIQLWHHRVWLEHQSTATMIDYLYKKVTRPKIVWPAFIYNYPKSMQPLARPSDLQPLIVEQWQLLVNGWEIIKAYSELVDPVIQQHNFDEQLSAITQGDDETTQGDDDFVLAMQYGMPPQSGRGMWIDRVFSLLTSQSNVRDVVLFPITKPLNLQ